MLAGLYAALSAIPALAGGTPATKTPAHGIIDFIVDANHVRFDIVDEAAARNGLVISSELLNVARSVRSGP